MTTIKKSIGRLPVYKGEYDGTKRYAMMNRVTLFGSEFQSLVDNNGYAPATINEAGTRITFDTLHWKVVSNGTDAYLLSNTVSQKIAEVEGIISEQNALMEEVETKLDTLNGNDVEVVSALPAAASAETGRIYRLQGQTSYTDYMLNKAGTELVVIATYAFPGIDDEPEAGSDNLVKSGGIAKKVKDVDHIRNKLTYKKSENLFDKDDYVTGLLDKDGKTIRTDGSYINYRSTGFIDVSDVDAIYSYTINVMGTLVSSYALYRAFLYDSSFAKIDMVSDAENVDVSAAHYIRISFVYDSTYDNAARIMLTTSPVAPESYIQYFAPFYYASIDFIKEAFDSLTEDIRIVRTNLLYQNKTVSVDKRGAVLLYEQSTDLSGEYSMRIDSITGSVYVNNAYIHIDFEDGTNQRIYNQNKEGILISAYLNSYGKKPTRVAFYVYPFTSNPSPAEIAEYSNVIITNNLFVPYKYIKEDVYASRVLRTAYSEHQRSSTVNTYCHRGYALLAPENSASAMMEARRHGFYGIESDIQVTKDGKYVMWHDSNMGKLGTAPVDKHGRTLMFSQNNENVYFFDSDLSQLYKFSGDTLVVDSSTAVSSLHQLQGNAITISMLTLNEWRMVNTFGWFSDEFKDEDILTFEECVRLCHQLGLAVNIDKKINYNTAFGEDAREKVGELVGIVRHSGMLRHVIWNCTVNEPELIWEHDSKAICRFVVPATAQMMTDGAYVKNLLAEHPWQLQFSPDISSVTEESCKLAIDNNAYPSFYVVTNLHQDYKHIYPIKKDLYESIWKAVGWGCQDVCMDCLTMEEVIGYMIGDGAIQ